jgi:hypothetical protein
MRSVLIPVSLLNLLAAAPVVAEAVLEARLQEESGGRLYLYTSTDTGRGYQVEWSTDLTAATWTPVLARPAEGTGGHLAFYLGQRPDTNGAPPVHPPRRDFTVLSYPDGTSLVQWTGTDGNVVRRRWAFDFRRVPRQAAAVVASATVTTRTQLSEAVVPLPVTGVEDPDPDVRAALRDLAEAYPLLPFSMPDFTVRQAAVAGTLTDTRFWRVRQVEQDTDTDGLNDYAEWHTLLTNPMVADTDGDGVSDRAEVVDGTSPVDYFNGRRPTVVRLPSRWGDVPYAGPGEWLDEPLQIEVRGPGGTPLAHAPLTATAGSGGLDLWSLPPTARSSRPVITARTDAHGRVALAWKAGTHADPASLIHAWCGEGQAWQGAHLLVHTVRALPPLEPTVLAWLKADAEVGTDPDGRVSSWSDAFRAVTATATGALRPAFNTSGPLPLIEFGGTQYLDLTTARGGSSMSLLVVAQPAATRTAAPPNAADPANRTPGLAGQRYLLAGEVSATASPWNYTAPVPRQLQTTQHFSRYSALFMLSYVSPAISFKGYECRPISTASGYLLPGLPAAQVPSVRYDVTANAIPDPGPPQRQNGKIYRLNPALANCPLKAGASLSSCLADFVTRRGLPATYQWDTRQLATYTRRVGNPLTDDFSEIYYEAKGYTPEVPEKYELQPDRIGTVGQGFSVGTNSLGYHHLSNDYAPALGTAPASTGLTLTSAVVTNGRPAFFTNGTAAGSSVAPAGGSATGIRFLGALANATNGFIGTVGDIVLTAGALTDDSRRALEDRLADRRRLTRIDRDADGLPDWWEHRVLSAGTAAAPTGNPDADGLTNTQERARFTLPELADSDRDGLTDGTESDAAAITADTDGDGFLDGADATPNDPANGRADANGDGIPDGLAARLAAPNQRDSDGDGLSDLVESITTRTNPLDPDTDGDTLPDAWEHAYQLDPNNPAGSEGRDGDPDGDGKTNAEERALGTHPRVAE